MPGPKRDNKRNDRDSYDKGEGKNGMRMRRAKRKVTNKSINVSLEKFNHIVILF